MYQQTTGAQDVDLHQNNYTIFAVICELKFHIQKAAGGYPIGIATC